MVRKSGILPANVWFRHDQETIQKNARRPLIQDLTHWSFETIPPTAKSISFMGTYIFKDPMVGDPVFQMMGSRGCIYQCSYCYNSNVQERYLPRTEVVPYSFPNAMIEEIKQAQTHWDFKRIRFDDEVFNFRMDWLKDFCERYTRDVGLPFEVFIEPKLVNEHL